MPPSGAHLESSKTEVVLVGSFKPDEARPDNLVRTNTLGSKEAGAAKFINLLHGQIVEFDLDWGRVQVVQQRFSVTTSKTPYVRAADFVLKVVKEACTGVAVTMFGINREFQYKFSTHAARDAFGIRIAPPLPWGPLGEAIHADQQAAKEDSLNRSGVLSVTMRKKNLEDGREGGWLDVTIAATGQVGDKEPGVLVRANDHYQFDVKFDPEVVSSDGHVGSRTQRLLDILARNFDESIKRSDNAIHGLME